MSFLASLCGCWTRPSPSPEDQHQHQPQPQPHHQHTHHQQPPTTDDGPDGPDGYTPIIPLPAYTARPQSIHEKTLEAHLRDPPISSSDTPHNPDTDPSLYPDEKSPYAYTPPSQRPEDLTSDVSSAISFPSSYGNTSTATRDTPPPPYSPRGWSPAPSRRRSMSISSVVQRQLVMTQIAQPRPVFHRPDGRVRERADTRRSLDEIAGGRRERTRRLSWESR